MKKKNLLLTAIAIFGLATITMAQTVPSYVPTSGLLGWWPFNGNGNDESGNGNSGTIYGAALTNDRFGALNSAYSFDGVNDYIQCAQSGLSGSQSMSVGFWVKTGSSSGHIFSFGADGNSGNDFRILINSYGSCGNSVAFDIYNAGTAFTTNFSNVWDFYVLVFNSDLGNSLSSASIYKNGIILTNNCFFVNSAPNFSNTFPITFGRYHGTIPSDYLNGQLDDIGFWNRALSVCEISDLYNSQLGSLNTTATQTVTALDTYTWPINSQTYTQSGTYTAVIPNSAGCDSTITLDLSLDFTGLEENSEGALFSVFPNPAQSTINVKLDIKLIGKVYSIYDNTGRVVLTGKVNSENTTIELGNLLGGIYMFSVGENMKQTFKVIKE